MLDLIRSSDTELTIEAISGSERKSASAPSNRCCPSEAVRHAVKHTTASTPATPAFAIHPSLITAPEFQVGSLLRR
jgi:hypothetical protein